MFAEMEKCTIYYYDANLHLTPQASAVVEGRSFSGCHQNK